MLFELYVHKKVTFATAMLKSMKNHTGKCPIVCLNIRFSKSILNLHFPASLEVSQTGCKWLSTPALDTGSSESSF